MKSKAGRKIIGFAAWLAAGFAGFAGLYLLAGWGCSRIVVGGKEKAPDQVGIYIMTNGKHTDIVMPVRNEVIDWSVELPFSNNVSPDTVYSYLGLGWGDKGFFLDMPTWDDLTFRLAFNAAFWCSTTAMHATYHKRVAEDAMCRRIGISCEQYARLVEFIKGRFITDNQGHFVNIPTNAAYGPSDAFYEARGRYNLFYSCNTWANDALAAAGQRHCLWTFSDRGIFLIYE